MAIDKRACKIGILIGLSAFIMLAIILWFVYHDKYQINWPVINVLAFEVGLVILYFFIKNGND